MTNRKAPPIEPAPQAPPEGENPNDNLSPTQVAFLIGRKYQYTRDLMLSGAFGEPKFVSSKLTVTRQQVTDFKLRSASGGRPKSAS